MNVDSPFRFISLFSGGGGLDLGVHRVFPNARCVAYVESEAFCTAVLAARMEEGSLAKAPIHTDVASFPGRKFLGLVDGVVGGSPCTDMSVAGKRAGLTGTRSGLFYEMGRIIGECEPAWVFWENVLGAKKFLPQIFEEFERLGYTGKGTVVRASDVGAPHQRARIFVLAHRTGTRFQGRVGRGLQQGESPPVDRGMGDSERVVDELQRGPRELPGEIEAAGRAGFAAAWGESWATGEELADCDDRGQPQREGDVAELGRWVGDGGASMADAVAGGLSAGTEVSSRPGSQLAEPPCGGERMARPEWPPGPDGDWTGIDPRFYSAQPAVRRMADGLAGKLDQSIWADRLRALGNGVVPAQAEEAIRFLFRAMSDPTSK